MKVIFIIFLLITFISCSINPNQNCEGEKLKHISFWNDSVKISLPNSWYIPDTNYYRSDGLVFSKEMMNEDTSSFCYISAYDYGQYSQVLISSNSIFNNLRGKMTGRNNQILKLVKDTVIKVNKHDVNFQTYEHFRNGRKVVDAGIAFVLPEKKYVEIEVRITQNTNSHPEKTLDCIFYSLKIK